MYSLVLKILFSKPTLALSPLQLLNANQKPWKRLHLAVKKKINKAHIQCIGKSTELPRMGMYSPEYTCMFKCQLMQLSLLSFHLSKCSNCFH